MASKIFLFCFIIFKLFIIVSMKDKNDSSNSDDTEIGLWKDGRIPYLLDEYLMNHHKGIILEAMNDFHMHTCIRFIPYESKHKYYMYMKKGKKYSTYPGINVVNNKTEVVLDLDYEHETKRNKTQTKMERLRAIRHELAHVVGLFHEHQRPDRDNFIETIQESCSCTLLINNSDWNCNPLTKISYFSMNKNFRYPIVTIVDTNISEWFNHVVDQESITFYPDCFIQKDSQPMPIVFKYELSNYDIQKIKKLYNCK